MTPRRSSASFAREGVVHPDEQEVGDGGACRIEPMLAEHVLEPAHRLPVRRTAPLELLRPVEARERRLLPGGGHVERAAHLADGGDDVLGADSIPDPEPREAEDLGERPQDEDAVARLEVLRDSLRIVGIVDVLEVRLVEDGQDVPRNAREVRVELGPAVRRSRRVVGRSDEDELRPSA